MKNRLTAILAASFAAAAASYAASRTIEGGYVVSTANTTENYIFAGDASGKSYLTTTVDSQVRNLNQVSGAFVGTFDINSGVSAIINFTTTPIEGHSSTYDNVGFRFGGSENTVNGSATLTGAGADVSSLSFYGKWFDTGHVASSAASGNAQDTMTISALTLNFNGTQQFGSNYLVVENSALNVNSGYISTYTSSTTLTNSTLNYNSTNTTSKLGALSLTNSAVNISNGAFSITSAALENSSMSNSSETAMALKSVTLSGVNEFKGTGNFTQSGTITTTSGTSTYIALDGGTFRFASGEFFNNTGALYIGVDALGNAHNTVFTGQIENRSTFVAKGNTTISGAYLNLRGTVDIASTVSLTSSQQTRMVKGVMDGSLTTLGRQYNTTYGWDYSLGLGVWGTSKFRADGLTIGENAQVNVNPSTATYFSIYGDVAINAGEGKIVSNANAPLFIYDTTNLTLNSTDAFAVGGAASQAVSTFNLASAASAKMIINANNNLGSFRFEGAGSTLALSIAEGKLFNIGSFVRDGDFTMSVALDDTLARGEFKINDMDAILSTYAAQDVIVFVNAGGAARTLDVDLFIEQSEDYFYVYTVAVPEPAAAAFAAGLLAIALALYLRRK